LTTCAKATRSLSRDFDVNDLDLNNVSKLAAGMLDARRGRDIPA
jgi:hypothetical protein